MTGTDIPQTRDEALEAAILRGLAIPDACMPGVLANLALLATHAQRLRAPAKDETA